MARVVVCLSLVLALCGFVFAQNQPLCGVTCEPNPTSSTYLGSTVKARAVPANGRGGSSVLAANLKIGGPIRVKDPRIWTVIPASQSYNYAVPILDLPGRNGLDLHLSLYYNSRIWNIATSNGVNSSASFNADRDFPSYGFRLGFGYIEGPFTNSINTQSYTLTEPDGSKREMRFSSGTLYVTFDSSYIDWNSSTKVLRRKNGTQWTYQQVGTGKIYRPIKIQDTNGNYISISYSTATGASDQAIDTITDTLGRQIVFNYTNNLLTSLSQGATTLAYFYWNTSYTLKYNFTLAIVDSPANNSTQNVLIGCKYPAANGSGSGVGYGFTYGDWGIVNQISKLNASGQVRWSANYNYQSAQSAPLSDHPWFTTETVFDGVNSAQWTYSKTVSGGQVGSFSVTDPAGTQNTTTLSTSGWLTGLVSSTAIKSGTTTLRTVNNSWTQDNTSLSYALNPRLSSAVTYLSDSVPTQVTSVAMLYGANGNPTQVSEGGFGLTLRTTQTDYLTSSAYTSSHILDRPTQVRVYDGTSGGTLVSRTDVAYDLTAPTLVGGAAQHDDSGHGTGFTTRGNATVLTRYKNATAGTGVIPRQFAYDTLGNLISAQVSCCNLEQWTYTSTTQYAYPTTIKRGPDVGPQLTTTRTYDFNTGALLSETDPNLKTTNLAYDALQRLTTITRPDSTNFTTSYDDNSAFFAITSTSPIDATNSVVQVVTTDGAGRAMKQETKNAGGTTISVVEAQYNGLGQALQLSIPHGPADTPIWIQKNYDALGRLTKTIPPDGSSTSNNLRYTYSGNAVTVTDPAGKQRRTFTDGVGRVSQVDEPGWGSATPGTGAGSISGAPAYVCTEPAPPPQTCGGQLYDTGTVSITVASYTASAGYSRFTTPTSVAAALASNFNTHSASPVTATSSAGMVTVTAKTAGASTNYPLSASATSNNPAYFPTPSYSAGSGPNLTGGTDTATPEAPTLDHPLQTFYTYDPLDNLKLVTQGVQARTYVYDGLGRLTQATTPESGALNYTYTDFDEVLTRTDARNVVATFAYDGLNRKVGVSYSIPEGVSSMPNACTTAVGTQANVCYTYGSSAAALNNGRITQMTDPTGSESYTFDQLGRVTQLTKGIGGTSYPIQYAYNLASEITSLTYPSGRVVAQSFDAIGRLSQIQSAGTSYLTVPAGSYNSASLPTTLTFGNGVQEDVGYNSHLQLASLRYSKSGIDLLNLTYNYNQTLNGQTVNNGQIQGITDTRGAAYSTAYTYDAWNRLSVAQTNDLTAANTWKLGWTYDRYGNRISQSLQGGTISVTAPQLTISTTTNRLTTTGYTYDVAGNMTNDSIHTYAYDGNNRLTAVDGTAASYSYDGSGLRLKKVVGSSTTTYLFSGSKVIAEYVGGVLTKGIYLF